MTTETGRRPIRVVLSKIGLDGHDRGVKVLAQALRDAGMEVIYAGIRRSPQEITRMVIEEDADVLGLSILSGAVLPLTRRVVDALAAAQVDDVVLLVGGIVQQDNVAELEAMGVKGIFGPGTSLAEVIRFIRDSVGAARTF